VVESVCNYCNRCHECCECFAAKFCDRKVKFIDGTNFDKNPSERYIAAELEFTDCKNFNSIDDACNEWSISVVEDGSLPEQGFELNTSPASGDKWIEMIESVCDALDSGKADVDSSCGYHVHIDARDYDFVALHRLIEVYALIENALFSVVSLSRRDNEYCTRCGQIFLESSRDGTDPEDKTAKAVYGRYANRDDFQKAKSLKCPVGYGRIRYSALNLHSWNFRGILECRLHQGTRNAKNVINWGILWAAIIDWAKDRSASELPKQGWAALLAIAPTEDVREWLRERREKFSI